LVTSTSSTVSAHDHGQQAGLLCFLLGLAPRALCPLTVQNVGKRSVVENPYGSVTNVQEDLVKGAVIGIPSDEIPQLLGVCEWGNCTVNQPDDFAEPNL
jgi:hypothetical protein